MDNKTKIVIASTLLAVIAAVLLYVTYFNSTKETRVTPPHIVSVYFVKASGNNSFNVVPLSREIGENGRFRTAINYLLAGPTKEEKEQGYFSEIPKKTMLLEIKETKEMYTINLSQEFETGGGSASMALRMDQLINTALDAADKPVFLEIEGEQVSLIGGEGIAVPQPLSKVVEKEQELPPCD